MSFPVAYRGPCPRRAHREVASRGCPYVDLTGTPNVLQEDVPTGVNVEPYSRNGIHHARCGGIVLQGSKERGDFVANLFGVLLIDGRQRLS